MATQTVIVYRNPAEEAFWNMLMSAELVPVAIAGVVFMAVVVALNRLAEKVYGYRQPNWVQPVIWIMSGAAALAAGKYFWL